MACIRTIALFLAFISLVGRTHAQSETTLPPIVTPSLQGARWITDDKIERFEPGRTYVLLFWSTWSEPCRRAMPRIAALKREVGQSLTFIAVNVWEYDEIAGSRFDTRAEAFMKRSPGVLPMPVCVDDAPGLKGTLARTWLKASGIATLPSCVVIDEHGRIAWSGHPSELREHLATRLLLNAKSMEDYVVEAEATVRRFLIASREGDASAIAIAREAANGEMRENPAALNAFAWEMLDNVRFEGKDLALALDWARRAAEITNRADGMILDTLALALFENGRVDEAIKTQEDAVRLFEAAVGASSEELTDMQSRLKRFRQAQDTAR
jgi:thiol-disulfide isomerase/thioredoxin